MKFASVFLVLLALFASSEAFFSGGKKVVKIAPKKLGNKSGNFNNGGKRPRDFGLSSSSAGDDKNENNPFLNFLAAYDAATAKNPILIKGLTSVVGFSLGDILAQKFLDKADSFDYARLLRLASFGFLVHGPTGHFFYGFLDGAMPGKSAITVATKVAIDQILWNPIFGIMFFTYMTLAEGKTFEDVKKKIKNDLFTAVRGSWTVWPVAHAINFAFISNSQRLLYINTIQVFYNMFLSVLANKAKPAPTPAPAPAVAGKKK